MRILCTGDIHIGRRPTRLPEQADAARLTAAQAWMEVVSLAISMPVDLVVLTGDVVDRENRYFEAFGPLEEGLRSLEAARIPVVAVAGNHDFDVLPRLARSFPGNFRLLGGGGRWERATFEAGGVTVHLDGWSFPAEHHPSDPLADYRAVTPPGDGFLLGLVHGNLDQVQSRYAPLTTDNLLRAPVAFWLLGHVHAPRLAEEAGRPGILYPGSPLALSPRETGRHGPWVLELDRGGRIQASQVALSRVRYETVDVDLEGIADEEEVDRLVSEAVRRRLDEVLVADGDHLRHLICRLRLTGRTPIHRQVGRRLEGALGELAVARGPALASVESFTVATRPAWNLERLAEGVGPPAVLARFLLSLQGATPGGDGSVPRAELLRKARQTLERLAGSAPYRELGREELYPGIAATDEELVRTLERQGLLLLDELLAQQPGGGVL